MVDRVKRAPGWEAGSSDLRPGGGQRAVNPDLEIRTPRTGAGLVRPLGTPENVPPVIISATMLL